MEGVESLAHPVSAVWGVGVRRTRGAAMAESPDLPVGGDSGESALAAAIPAILRYLVHAEDDQRTVQRRLRETFGPRLQVRKLFDLDDLDVDALPAPELEDFYAATA